MINVAEELIRHANKVIISKIIKTDNKLSEELAQQYIDDAKKTNPYCENINSDNNKYWEGFTEEYVYSYKTKTIYDDDKRVQDKDYDSGINELFKGDVFISKIFKNSFAIRKGAFSNPNYVDTIILPDINLICIIGRKDFTDTPKEILYDFLNENEITFSEINIKHDFLLWMLWKLYENVEISDNITLESFENLRVGIPNSSNIEHDNTPPSIKTQESHLELPSLPICYGLFNKKSLNHFRGEFIYDDNHFIIIIDVFKKETENGFDETSRIHILSSGCLEDLHYSEKLQLSLLFINELADVIKEWEDYPNDKKYPSLDYIDKLFEKAKEEFDETEASFKEYREKYSKKIKE